MTWAALKHSLTRESLAKPGVTIIDLRVDYSHSTDLYAQLQNGVLV